MVLAKPIHSNVGLCMELASVCATEQLFSDVAMNASFAGSSARLSLQKTKIWNFARAPPFWPHAGGGLVSAAKAHRKVPSNFTFRLRLRYIIENDFCFSIS